VRFDVPAVVRREMRNASQFNRENVMRYLLIDRVRRLEPHRHITAVKCVALSEDIYSDHFPGFPVMPGAMLIESLAQAGTALLEVSSKLSKKALLVMVDQAKFRAFVHPGDQLVITMDVRSSDESVVQMDGAIRVDGQLVTDARLTFALKDPAQFYPPQTRFMMETLYDTWLKGAEIVGQTRPGDSR
jgi:3-hydroxyacyl-[acyl-carrier-protein] dehydratase